MTGRWLIDKSAYSRLRESPDLDQWLNRINRGLVHISSATLLEIGWSSRSGAEWRELLDEPPVTRLIVEYLSPTAEERALQVQQLLAGRGQHRAPGVPDLLIAATAEVARLTVLHVDKDFDLIAGVTGQPVGRLRGDW